MLKTISHLPQETRDRFRELADNYLLDGTAEPSTSAPRTIPPPQQLDLSDPGPSTILRTGMQEEDMLVRAEATRKRARELNLRRKQPAKRPRHAVYGLVLLI
jgi:hypothetical protein